MKFGHSILAALLFTLGCASTGQPDELAGESADEVGGKADGAVDGASTYFEIATSGNGFTLARLNRATTVCHDGSTKAACWTPVLDWSETHVAVAVQQKLLAAAGKNAGTGGVYGVVRGRFAKTPSQGRFVVTEAWIAEGEGLADGVFARIVDNGVRCITAPCPSMTEKGLNGSSTAAIAALDFSVAGLSPHEIAAFQANVADPSGILVAGFRYTDHENGHAAKGRTVTNAYHRLADADACYHAGCSHQVCSDNPSLITTCQWQPEYACYQQATCERQTDGACGFTASAALDSCLGNLN